MQSLTDYFIITMMKANFDFIKGPRSWPLGQFVGEGVVGGGAVDL